MVGLLVDADGILLMKPTLDFSLPPINGLTAQSRHASYTGAVKALKTRSRNLERLRALWVDAWTINEIAAITCLPISSVCSLKAALDLEPVGFQVQTWGDGHRPTKRTVWRLRV